MSRKKLRTLKNPLNKAKFMLSKGKSKTEVLDYLKRNGFLFHGSNRSGLRIMDPKLSKEKETSLSPEPEYSKFMAIRPSKGINTGDKNSFIVSSRKFNKGSVYVVPRDKSQRVFEIKDVNGKRILTEIRTSQPVKPVMEIPVERSDVQRRIKWSPKLAVTYFFQSPGCHTQAKTLDELMVRIKEAAELYLKEETKIKLPLPKQFIGIQRVEVAV